MEDTHREEAKVKHPERVTYEVTEVANRLGISRNAAYAAIHSGTIPALRVGRRLIVPIASFEAWLASSTATEPSQRNL